MTIGIGFVVGSQTVLACDHVISPRQARDLRRGIDDVSRLRYTLAHENAHLHLEGNSPNASEMTAVLEAFEWLAGVVRFDEQPQMPLTGAVPPSAPLAQNQNTGHGVVGLPRPRLRLAFREDVLPRDNGSTFLRLLDGILAALCLMLMRVLAALSRQPDALTFVLIMLAACLRYGRRGEPDDHASLPIRRYQTSLGSRPES
jgi:hypothetical protein